MEGKSWRKQILDIKTDAGIFMIDSYKIPDKYTCEKRAQIIQQGDCIEIVTYDQKVKVDGKIYAPVIHQSCMHPEQITLYPLVIRLEKCMMTISDHYNTGYWKLGENIEIADWRPLVKRRGCFPCTNCGRC